MAERRAGWEIILTRIESLIHARFEGAPLVPILLPMLEELTVFDPVEARQAIEHARALLEQAKQMGRGRGLVTTSLERFITHIELTL